MIKPKFISNYLDKWASDRVNAKKAIVEQENAKQETSILRYQEIRKNVRAACESLVNESAIAIMKTPCHIAVGDKAILNCFDIGRKGTSEWDGGPHTLIKYLSNEEKQFPVIVKITEIFADKSLASDRIDKFMDNNRIDKEEMSTANIQKVYRAWYKERYKKDYTYGYGVYRTANFAIVGNFHPTWGLHVDAFLAEGTDDFATTFSFWVEKGKLEKTILECGERKKALYEHLKNLDAAIRAAAIC